LTYEGNEQMNFKTPNEARCKYFTPAILAIWKAEIRRIFVQGHLKVGRPHLNGKKLGVVAHTIHLSNSRKPKMEYCSTDHLGQKVRPYVQIN
jgi:hypothetical protein